jgi:serine/threonine protein kinase
LNDYILGK